MTHRACLLYWLGQGLLAPRLALRAFLAAHMVVRTYDAGVVFVVVFFFTDGAIHRVSDWHCRCQNALSRVPLVDCFMHRVRSHLYQHFNDLLKYFFFIVYPMLYCNIP